jgi:fatty acid CoA ligase FadD32
VKVALNGSEPVRPATVAAFEAAFGPLGFPRSAQRPCYGLAEATVFVASAGAEGPTVTAFDRVALHDGRAVPVGQHTPNAELLVAVGRTCGQLMLIVDKSTRKISPLGELGEIWVRGSNVAGGYWGHPERAGGTFDGRLAEAPGRFPANGWLRTGDLGMLYEGLLYVTGRLKDLIIVDGRNHYPQDIEETVATAHAAIRRDRVAAFAVPGSTGEGIVVVAECGPAAIRRQADHESVAKAVRRAVSARHELALRDVQLVRPGTVPRTSSGKVSRTAARDRWRDSARDME